MFGLILVLLIIICAIFAPLLAPYDPLAQDVMIKLKDPIWGADPVAGHLLGTDQLGRDILSRLLYGARVTLIVALAGTVVGGIVGVVLGSLAGYYGKWVDAVIMRLVDIQLCFPFTLLALFIAAVLGSSLGNVILIAGITSWVRYARCRRHRCPHHFQTYPAQYHQPCHRYRHPGDGQDRTDRGLPQLPGLRCPYHHPHLGADAQRSP